VCEPRNLAGENDNGAPLGAVSADVRAEWDARVAATLAGLDFTQELRAAVRPWPEADEDGGLVMRG
jgi:hypothetical protein